MVTTFSLRDCRQKQKQLGVSAIEYALALAVIVTMVMVGAKLMKPQLDAAFENASDCISHIASTGNVNCGSGSASNSDIPITAQTGTPENSGTNKPRGKYTMPLYTIKALEELFGETVSNIKVVQNSRYAAMHGQILATTRKEKILLNIDGDDFTKDLDLVLHEYYHVVKQWRTGDLTRSKYLIESAKNGYENNKYEVEARDFAEKNVKKFKQLLDKHKQQEP